MLDISEVDLPDIYVCPDDQYNLTALYEHGYSTRNMLLSGSTNPKPGYYVISWGLHMNKTFDEMLDDILPDILENNDKNPKIAHARKVEKVFLARYGFCIRIRQYNPTELIIYTMNQTHTVYVLLADKYKHTYPNPNFSSKSGEMIALSPGVEKWYTVKISLTSNENPLQKDACEYYDDVESTYADCVDSKIQSVMFPILGCNPPYLSPTGKCNEIYDGKKKQKFLKETDFWKSYLKNLIDLEPMTIQDNCTDPCLTTTIDVQLHSTGKPDHPMKTYARVNLRFKKEVEKRYRVISYDFYNFLIDIGSSLGLWLGISVFSLTDIALQMVNSMRSCKRWSKI